MAKLSPVETTGFSSLRRIRSFLRVTMFALVPLLWLKAAAVEVDLSNVDFAANSLIGTELLSKARRLEQNKENWATSWLSGYSIKFLGCHHIRQWNDQAEEKEDIRIKMKRLVRFRLCPSNSCTSHNDHGCLENYGDFVVDLQSFMQAYFEIITNQSSEYECKRYYNKNCNCENQDDDQYANECAYKCFAAAGLEACTGGKNDATYDDDANQVETFDPSYYMTCEQFQIADADDSNDAQRHLEDGGQDNSQFYIGPFCRHQGGTVMLGMFTDDTCSEFVDNTNGRATFKSLTGFDLPYSAISLIKPHCVSCQGLQQDQGGNDDYAQQDTLEAMEACQQIYAKAGKCETKLSTVDLQNTAACKYIQGVRLVRQDGIATGSSGPNGLTNLLIVFFAICCAALGQYVQYLQKILKHKAVARALLPSDGVRRRRKR